MGSLTARSGGSAGGSARAGRLAVDLSLLARQKRLLRCRQLGAVIHRWGKGARSAAQFMDNARGQWKPYRGWFGTFVENVVQGTARLPAALLTTAMIAIILIGVAKNPLGTTYLAQSNATSSHVMLNGLARTLFDHR